MRRSLQGGHLPQGTGILDILPFTSMMSGESQAMLHMRSAKLWKFAHGADVVENMSVDGVV